MTAEHVVSNARIVTATEEFRGCMKVVDGQIVDISRGATTARNADDWKGDYLLPGLIELHTDNLEKHLMPRPKVNWPAFPALLSHDAEVAAAGITTVLDALGVGDVDEAAMRGQDMRPLLDSIDDAEKHGLLRADHLLHVRCELPAPNTIPLFEPFHGNRRLKLLSLMDHTPGQRQWTDVEKARTYYTGKKGWSDEKFDQVVSESAELQERFAAPHRDYFIKYARAHGIPLASHDDTTEEHVEQALVEGVAISEFPTTSAAARRAQSAGLGTVMGAPNVVRGGSHSGNACATQLAREGLLDVLSSDYVPSSLLHAAFMLVERADFTVPRAVATISANPARLTGLDDRGEISIGRRADYCRVRVTRGMPSVVCVWREGRRIV